MYIGALILGGPTRNVSSADRYKEPGHFSQNGSFDWAIVQASKPFPVTKCTGEGRIPVSSRVAHVLRLPKVLGIFTFAYRHHGTLPNVPMADCSAGDSRACIVRSKVRKIISFFSLIVKIATHSHPRNRWAKLRTSTTARNDL